MTKRRSPTLSAVLLAAPLVVAMLPSHADAEGSGSTLTVSVGRFRNRKGMLGCRLYRAPAGFPESSAGTTEKRVPIVGDVTVCTFEGVAPGTYAVSVMHDENDNQKLDKNFFGVPVEGYGVSNNHTYALKSPLWEESTFTVDATRAKSLSITLRY